MSTKQSKGRRQIQFNKVAERIIQEAIQNPNPNDVIPYLAEKFYKYGNPLETFGWFAKYVESQGGWVQVGLPIFVDQRTGEKDKLNGKRWFSKYHDASMVFLKQDVKDRLKNLRNG